MELVIVQKIAPREASVIHLFSLVYEQEAFGSELTFFNQCSEAERERVVGILMSQPELASALPGGRSAAAIGASILEVSWLQRSR